MPTATLSPPTRATDALLQSPLADLRKLSVQETEVAVLIQGKVSSYYLKQMAQETVMPALAGRCLVNRVTVVRN